MSSLNREKARLQSLIVRLKGQLAVLEDAYDVTLEPYKKADLKGSIEEIQAKISSYEEELRDALKITKVRIETELGKSKKLTDRKILQKIKVNVEELRPQVKKVFDKTENQFTEIGYLPTNEFRICINSFKDLLDEALAVKSLKERGIVLEKIAEYLFRSTNLFDVVYSRKRTATHEIDKVVFTSPASFFREWGDFLIVECKNQKRPADTKVIDALIANIRGTKSKAGVLFSMAGVTSVAKKNIRENYLRDDIIIIAIDQKDLEQIAGGGNFIKLLWDKYKALRFG